MLQCCSIDAPSRARYIREKGNDFSPTKPKRRQGRFCGGLAAGDYRPFFPYRSDAMRVAIYARVSTDDKGQDPENQLGELRAWVVNSSHAISGE
jgi:hypothetical protein